jgi:hypothetical protein|tara:strand:- start:1206 stop:2204 length:999 start_codon:yes stop_codon:yes gene_type:complete
MKIAFLSENNFLGKVPRDFENARTEFAWMLALDAKHYPLNNFTEVKDYDSVFIILPKLRTYLSADATQMVEPQPDHKASFCTPKFFEYIKSNNKKAYIIQEGPNWLFNDYEVNQQLDHLFSLDACDGIFVHNEIDEKFFKGITYGNKLVKIIPTLMIEDAIKKIKSNPKDKTLVGGNFSRWYGGFQSFMVARLFSNEIWTQSSHSKRTGEDGVEGLNHIPRVSWVDWIKEVSEFKYAVHLMPTVAAGTFSLNCAYFGIPCIGNVKVDTQRICFPDLSVDIDDIESANKIADRLKTDEDFYNKCSKKALKNYKKYFKEETFKKKMLEILNEKD